MMIKKRIKQRRMVKIEECKNEELVKK